MADKYFSELPVVISIGDTAILPIEEAGITSTITWGNLKGIIPGSGTWLRDALNGYVYLANLTDSIGIGMNNPAYELDVLGDIHASGALISGSSIRVDGSVNPGTITESHGLLTLSGTGGVNNESFTFNFESVADTIGISSTTGATLFDFGTMSLEAYNLNLGGDLALLPAPAVEPADGVIANNQYTMWLDELAGVFTIKGKDSVGTIVEGQIVTDAQDEWLRDTINGYIFPKTLTDRVGVGTITPSSLFHVVGLTTFGGDIQTDRWLNQTTNTFVGRGVVGFGTLAHVGGDDGYKNTVIGSNAMYYATTAHSNTVLGWNALYSDTTGNSNIAIGIESLYSNTTGNLNAAIGNAALYSNTTGAANFALGIYSMFNNTTGGSNTAIGYEAMRRNTTGQQNIGIGRSALFNNQIGNYNVAIGNNALNTTTASNNTAIGYNSAQVTTTGSNIVAIGYESLLANIAAGSLVCIGAGALRNHTDPSGIVAIGAESMGNATGGVNNIAIGYRPLYNNSSGAGNVAIGNNALILNTTGGLNVAISGALSKNTTGSSNIGIGNNSLGENIAGLSNVGIGNNSARYATGNYNIGIGEYALYNTSGANNVAIGYTAGQGSAGSSQNNNTFLGYASGGTNITTGNSNVAVGSQSLRSLTTADSIVSIGYNAAYSLTSGTYVVAIGRSALYNSTTTGQNIAIGYDAGYGAIGNTAQNNIFIGQQVGRVITSASSNTSVGQTSLFSATTAVENSSLGSDTLYSLTTGSSNTAIGRAALRTLITGSRNTAIGSRALYTSIVSDNLAIGHDVARLATTAANILAIGNYALDALTTGANNFAIGMNALGAVTTGQTNMAIGYGAGSLITTGSSNILVGDSSVAPANASENIGIGSDMSVGSSQNVGIGHGIKMNSSTTNNIAIGNYVFGDTDTTTAQYNIAIGTGSMFIASTASRNIALGANTLMNVSTGSDNITLGDSAGGGISTGNYNTCIGVNTGVVNIGTGSNNILIGNNIDVPAVNTSNYMNIGGTIYGDLSLDYIGIGTTAPSTRLDVEGGVALLPAPNTAVADATLANSQWTLWLDEVNNEFELKAKRANGVVLNTTIATASQLYWSRNSGSGYVYPTTLTDRIGIGLNAPTEMLDVLGNIHASGTITSGSSIQINGSANPGTILESHGLLTIGGMSGTNNERLTFDFETTPNTVAITSPTGVTDINLTGLNLTVGGNLTVSGTVTTINTTDLLVKDNYITFNYGFTGPATLNAGIEVERGDDTNASLLWNENLDQWECGLVGTEKKILTDNGGVFTVNNLTTSEGTISLADDASIALPTGVSGFGFVMIGDNQEVAHFSFGANGSVFIMSSTANVVDTDTDGNLCIFDAGTNVQIRNRLGSSLTMKYSFKY